MIKTFRNKALAELFATKDSAKIRPEHKARVLEMLDVMNAATNIKQVDVPGYKLHSLKHVNRDLWSIRVREPWRLTFVFLDGNAYDVDYVQYH